MRPNPQVRSAIESLLPLDARRARQPTTRALRVGGRMIGDGFPTFVVAEIGINHNGELALAKALTRSKF